MSMLIRLYPGDQVLGGALAAILGVTLISSTAWLVARRLFRNAELRYLVLFAALNCCLTLPAVVWYCSAARLTLFSIPVIGQEERRDVYDLHRMTAQFVESPRLPLADPPRINTPELSPTASEPSRLVVAAELAADSTRLMSTPATPSVEPARSDEPTSSSLRGIAAALSLVWGVGFLLMLMRLARDCGRVVVLRQLSQHARDDRLLRIAGEIAATLGMRGVPRLHVTSKAVAPVAAGFLKPAVILPDCLLAVLNDNELGDVLVHEFAHLARGDQRIVLLQALAEALYWPIVPVHALIRELGRASEAVCDNAVLAGGDAIGYGETLLHIAELLVDVRAFRAAAGIVGARGELERRVAGLIGDRNPSAAVSRKASCLVWFLIFGAGLIPATMRFAASTRISGDEPAQAVTVAAESPAKAEPKPADTKVSTQPKPVAAEDSNRAIVLKGKVLGPNDRPIAGARLYVNVDEWTDPIDVGATDSNGAYRLTVPEKTLRRKVTAGFNYDACRASLLVFAYGYGSGSHELLDSSGGRYGEMKPEYSQDFHLAPDFPITGKVVDNDGNPVAGAVLSVSAIFELSGRRWWKMHPAIQAGKPGLLTREEIDTNNWATSLYPTAWKMIPPGTTDADGRFTIVGGGTDRAVRLSVSGPGIRSATVSVITRDDVAEFTRDTRLKYPRARRPNGYFYPERKDAPEGDQGVRLFGPLPTIEVDPARTVTGFVRDASTGEPIAGLSVRAVDGFGAGHAVTDKQGRYRFLRAEEYESLMVYVQPDAPDRYLTVVYQLANAKGLGELVANFEMPRGVIISGRVLEEGTGRPIVSAPRHGCHDAGPGPLVAGNVVYFPLANNTGLRGKPHGLYFEGFPTGSSNYPLYAAIAPDGRYYIAVPPGPGVLFVQSSPGMPMFAESQTWKESDGLHRLFPYPTLTERANDGVPGGDRQNLPGFAAPIPITGYHAYHVISPPADAKSLDLTLTVRRARSRLLRFVGPDGRPIHGVTVRGLVYPAETLSVTLDGSEAVVLGLRPGQTREVVATSSDGKYGATTTVGANDRTPMTIQLLPLKAATGFLR